MASPAEFAFDEKVLTLGRESTILHATIDGSGAWTPESTIVVPPPPQMLLPGGDILVEAAAAGPQNPSGGAGNDLVGGAVQQAGTLDTGQDASHIVIDATFDASVLDASGVTASYESAVDTAIQYYESEITTPITVDIDFGWGEIGGSSIEAGALGESSTYYDTYTYNQVYNAVTALADPSAIQQAAYATLPSRDPTHGGTMIVPTAQAAALGLDSSGTAVLAGDVGLDSTSSFFWSQSSPTAGADDAVGVFEHEISEVLGRIDEGGAGNTNGRGGDYTLLDMFRYTAAACYLRGTRVRTPRGDVKVEALREGQAVLTADGRAAPIRWIGRRHYDAALAATSRTVHPIRFRAGSLAPRVPVRDLLMSPLHAMLLDGMLVPAMLLVNGVSVVREAPCGAIAYFHVELDRHEIVLAEGAAAESFRDEGSRCLFDNADGWHGRGAVGGRCAPKVEHGFALEATRRRIDARAGIAAGDGFGRHGFGLALPGSNFVVSERV
jgi:hypothetical protein